MKQIQCITADCKHAISAPCMQQEQSLKTVIAVSLMAPYFHKL